MILNYVIEDCDGLEITAGFEFHRELDGQLVFDGAWDIISVIGDEGEDITTWVDESTITRLVLSWLSTPKGPAKWTGEESIYSAAYREFK